MSPEQTLPVGLTDMVTPRAGPVEMVMVMALLVAGLPLTQAAFEVMTTVTVFPFVKVVVHKLSLVAPGWFTPFTCHWKVGVVPPFTGVATNNTESPAQMVVPGEAAIVTEAGAAAVI